MCYMSISHGVNNDVKFLHSSPVSHRVRSNKAGKRANNSTKENKNKYTIETLFTAVKQSSKNNYCLQPKNDNKEVKSKDKIDNENLCKSLDSAEDPYNYVSKVISDARVETTVEKKNKITSEPWKTTIIFCPTEEDAKEECDNYSLDIDYPYNCVAERNGAIQTVPVNDKINFEKLQSSDPYNCVTEKNSPDGKRDIKGKSDEKKQDCKVPCIYVKKMQSKKANTIGKDNSKYQFNEKSMIEKVQSKDFCNSDHKEKLESRDPYNCVTKKKNQGNKPQSNKINDGKKVDCIDPYNCVKNNIEKLERRDPYNCVFEKKSQADKTQSKKTNDGKKLDCNDPYNCVKNVESKKEKMIEEVNGKVVCKTDHKQEVENKKCSRKVTGNKGKSKQLKNNLSLSDSLDREQCQEIGKLISKKIAEKYGKKQMNTTFSDSKTTKSDDIKEDNPVSSMDCETDNKCEKNKNQVLCVDDRKTSSKKARRPKRARKCDRLFKVEKIKQEVDKNKEENKKVEESDSCNSEEKIKTTYNFFNRKRSVAKNPEIAKFLVNRCKSEKETIKKESLCKNNHVVLKKDDKILNEEVDETKNTNYLQECNSRKEQESSEFMEHCRRLKEIIENKRSDMNFCSNEGNITTDLFKDSKNVVSSKDCAKIQDNIEEKKDPCEELSKKPCTEKIKTCDEPVSAAKDEKYLCQFVMEALRKPKTQNFYEREMSEKANKKELRKVIAKTCVYNGAADELEKTKSSKASHLDSCEPKNLDVARSQSLQNGLKNLTPMLEENDEESRCQDMGLLRQCMKMMKLQDGPVVNPITAEEAEQEMSRDDQKIVCKVMNIGFGEKMVCSTEKAFNSATNGSKIADFEEAAVKRILTCIIVKDNKGQEKFICTELTPREKIGKKGTKEILDLFKENCKPHKKMKGKIKVISNKLICRKVIASGTLKKGEEIINAGEMCCKIGRVEEIKTLKKQKEKTVKLPRKKQLMTYHDLVKKYKEKKSKEEGRWSVAPGKDKKKKEPKLDCKNLMSSRTSLY